MNAVILTTQEWEEKIKPELVKEHGAKINISWVMKRELDFTARYHRPASNMDFAFGKEEVHIDFYEESARTMFLLKFK